MSRVHGWVVVGGGGDWGPSLAVMMLLLAMRATDRTEVLLRAFQVTVTVTGGAGEKTGLGF